MKTRWSHSAIGSNGISLGVPLTNFQGVLRGVPTLVSDPTSAVGPETEY